MAVFECYRPHNFGAGRTDIIAKANAIIEDYEGQGYVLTLRQLYYRFIAKDLFPDSWIDRVYNAAHGLEPNTKNTEKNYKRLGEIVGLGREAGLISWTGIEDRGRTTYGTNTEEDPNNVLRGIERKLVYDLWARQDYHVEVWVEKQALESVIARPCNKMRVNYMATKGYLSLSESWRSSLRFKDAAEAGKQCVLLHLGDHDPSGIDMTRDNDDHMEMFLPGEVTVKRLALNMSQVKKYKPPPNPAKMTDSRAGGYVGKYGKNGWELDALEPAQLDALITRSIQKYIEPKAWEKALAKEKAARKTLGALAENWPAVESMLKKKIAGKKLSRSRTR